LLYLNLEEISVTQQRLKIVPFRSDNWQRLDSIILEKYAGNPDIRLIGNDGVLIARPFRSSCQFVTYVNHHEEEELIELIEKAGFMVEGKVPMPYTRVKPKAIKGWKPPEDEPELKKRKQDVDAMGRDIAAGGKLQSFMHGGYLYIHDDNDEAVLKKMKREWGFVPDDRDVQRSWRQGRNRR
jgi:hypothetical protein